MSRHDGVSCDSCTVSNFSGRRFKCLICSDYDLCSSCFDKAEHGHPPHPMQCLLNKKDFLVHFGETFKTKAQSFTCPCCGQMGFNLESLIVHSRAKHSEPHVRVLCPVCVANRHSLHPSATQDIATHLQREHSFGSGVRDIVALLEEPTGGVIVNRRNNLQLRFPDSLLESSSTFSSHLAQSVESVRPFNELLNHISNRCNEIGPVMLPRSMSRSHSKVTQGAKHREKGTASDVPNPSSNSQNSKPDYSDRFVSRNLELIRDVDVDLDLATDKGEFVQQLLLSCLDPKNIGILEEKDKKQVKVDPPAIPSCMAGTSVYLPKCIERMPSTTDTSEESPPSRRKNTKKSNNRRHKSIKDLKNE